ncbi:MAG: transketolase [Bacteroidia bacterium]|nr:transketolase [Bacteroidia bacterium]
MKKIDSIEELQKMAAQVRRDIVRMVYRVQSGHPGGSLGCADFLTTLYFKVLNHDPANFTMDGKDQDLFFLSNGHISPVWYSVLARSGYFPVEELNTFRFLNSRLQGHPATEEGLPGVRVASGSLGQGMSVAIGAAYAKKLNQDPNLVYTLHGDGELNEGQIWEAALFAPHHKIDNLISVIDRNSQQIDGPTEKVLAMGDIGAKFAAFGWQVISMDGHDLQNIIDTLARAKSMTGQGKPIAIIMHTEMGKGVDYMEGTHEWHGKPPTEPLFERAMAQLPETLGDF